MGSRGRSPITPVSKVWVFTAPIFTKLLVTESIFLTFTLPKFSQIEEKFVKYEQYFIYAPNQGKCFHCIDFHETQHDSTESHEDTVYQISSKSFVKRE